LVVFLAVLAAIPAGAHAVLSGANGRIVMVSGRDGGDASANVYLRTILSSTGGGSTGEAVASAAGQHRHPTWSPDRTMIAYARGDASCNPGKCDIFVLDLTRPGASPENITQTQNVNEDRPAWSPDGTRIAYESEVSAGSGQTDILIDELPAGTPTNLTDTAGAFEGKPAWTPDSETIFYHRGDPAVAGAMDILRRQADGGGAASDVAAAPGISEMQPSISPDGTEMCFTRGDFTNTGATDVIVSLANGGGQTPLALNAAGVADYNCTWSPDGTKIAWVQGAFTTGDLVMANSDNSGGFIALETTTGAFDGNPDWAPDGKSRCQDLEVAATVDTPVTIPIACEDTGPAYERTQVRAFVPAEAEPANGTVPDDVFTLPADTTYTPNAGFAGTDSFRFRSFDMISFGDRDGTITVRVDPPGEGPPDGVINDFTFGKVKKNKKRGTAKLTVIVPNPGEIELEKSKKIKGDDELAEAEGREKLKVRPKRKTKERLADKGAARVNARVTYTPEGGDPNTKTKRVKLKQK
jgi:Tol biopolymer transport system component